MGACLSCLGDDRERARSDASESGRLLNNDPYQSHYGALNGSANLSQSQQPDEEQIKRERDALERICAQTADKLIDVTQTSHADEGAKTAVYYERLFNATFQNVSQGEAVDDQVAWIQRIAAKNPDDRSWDWNTVQRIEGHATFDFDNVEQTSLDKGKHPVRG